MTHVVESPVVSRAARRRVALPLSCALVVGGVVLAGPALAAGVPGAPRSVTATGGDTTITVGWAAPSSDGGSAITGYTATCSGSGVASKSAAVGGSAVSATVTGVSNGVVYSCTVTAKNAIGSGPASTPASATPKGAPGVPRSVTNATVAGKITVKWKAPASDGGYPVTGYQAACTSTDGGAPLSATAAATDVKVTVAGLPDNKTYRCSVTATNAKGTSPAAKALGWAMHAVTTATARTVRMHVPVTAGRRVSAIANNTLFGPDSCADFYSSDPQGNVLKDSCLYDDNSVNQLLREATSPTAGTVTITVASPAGNTGTGELNAYVFDDFTGTVAANAVDKTYSFAYPGQSGRLSFTGTAGQQVSLLYSASTIGSTGYTSLQNAAGDELSYTGQFATSFMDTETLPATGTYYLVLDHGAVGGTATFKLYTVPANTGTITRGGSAASLSLPVPGENGVRTFSATAGQTVTVTYTGSTIAGGYVSIFDPTGSEIGYATLYDEPSYTGTTGQKTLTKTGTYSVVVDPSIFYTGNIKITLTA